MDTESQLTVMADFIRVSWGIYLYNTSIADICNITRNTFCSCLTEESAGQVVHQSQTEKLKNEKAPEKNEGITLSTVVFRRGLATRVNFSTDLTSNCPLLPMLTAEKKTKQGFRTSDSVDWTIGWNLSLLTRQKSSETKSTQSLHCQLSFSGFVLGTHLHQRHWESWIPWGTSAPHYCT